MAGVDRRARAAAAIAIAAAMGSTRLASADEPPRAAGGVEAPLAQGAPRARDLFGAAERAADERRYAEAVAGYEAAIAADPRASFAGHARAHLADLRAHAEGGFGPLARLDAVRRDPAKRVDRAEIEALERDLVDFPPGRVRSEARFLVAEAFWHAIGEPRRAAAPLRGVLDDPEADRLTRSLALAQLVALDRSLGDPRAAIEDARRHADLAPKLGDDLERAERRAWSRVLAIGLAVAIGVVGAASFAWAAVRARDPRRIAKAVVRPLAVALALGIGAAVALLVDRRGGVDPRPLLLLGPALLAVDVVARAWRIAWRDDRALARAVRATSCALGLAALLFLILDRAAASALDALGL